MQILRRLRLLRMTLLWEFFNNHLEKQNSSLRTPKRLRPAAKFQDLIVWQKAHLFILAIYRLTANFPKEETYGLTSQMRRAAISIAANIAEGFRKRTNADKGRFLNIAQGSIEESGYYLILTNDLRYGRTELGMEMLEEVSRLMNSNAKSIVSS